MCVAVVALSYFTFMFFYCYHFLLSSFICLTPSKVYDDDNDDHVQSHTHALILMAVSSELDVS